MTADPDLAVAGTPVYINRQVSLEELVANIANGGSIHLLCDSNTVQHCLPLVSDIASVHQPIVMHAGEEYKTLDTCQEVWSQLVRQGADRHSLLLNIGGGVVTDLGGYCASAYMRGIRFIHVPTTLLGMCDAAIGGKQGVDFDGLKNYIGAFVQPEMVWIDTQFLQSLGIRQLRNGMAEMIKHALIGNTVLFDRLSAMPAEPGDIGVDQWRDWIGDAVAVKKRFVEGDVLDHGARAALNFGHTIGHALESLSLSHSHSLLHGECVALGMLVEGWLSGQVLGSITVPVLDKISATIKAWVPVNMPGSFSVADLLPLIGRDKKGKEGETRFALITDIGSPVTDVAIGMERLRELLGSGEARSHFTWLKD